MLQRTNHHTLPGRGKTNAGYAVRNCGRLAVLALALLATAVALPPLAQAGTGRITVFTHNNIPGWIGRPHVEIYVNGNLRNWGDPNHDSGPTVSVRRGAKIRVVVTLHDIWGGSQRRRVRFTAVNKPEHVNIVWENGRVYVRH